MNFFDKETPVYVCELDEKKGKIFYDIKLDKFEITKRKNNTAASSLAFFSTMGYVVLRRANHITILENSLIWALVLTLVGGILGGIGIILINKLSKPVLMQDFNPSRNEIEHFVNRGEDLLSRQKGGIFFLSCIQILNYMNFLFSKDIVSLILIAVLWIGFFLFLNFIDLARRKKVYNLLRKHR